MKMRAKIVWVLSVGVVGYLVLVMVFGTGIRTGLSPNDLGVCKIFHKFDESLSNGD